MHKVLNEGPAGQSRAAHEPLLQYIRSLPPMELAQGPSALGPLAVKYAAYVAEKLAVLDVADSGLTPCLQVCLLRGQGQGGWGWGWGVGEGGALRGRR